jgi:hypothetical protein
MDNMKKKAIVLVLICGTLSVQAGIYKWTDENGKVHYTQTPPPKEGIRATINTTTFNTVQTVKASALPQRTRRTASKGCSTNKATKKKVKKRTQVKRSRCSRR